MMMKLVQQQAQRSTPPRERRVAVVLNGNARAVSEGIIRELGQVIQGESVFVSRSTDQSRFIARTILHRGYDVVLCGGGDGTFTQCVTDILSLRPAHPPAFGILRLGTGNALATSLGASAATPSGLAADLALARSAPEQQLPLLSVDGRLAPFAGFGLDALILEDYNRVKRCLGHTPLEGLGQGSLGYTVTVATRSLWRFMLEPGPAVTIRNLGAPTCRIDLQGRPLGRPVPRGGILYQGTVAIAAASTIPHYGLGLRLFPQADHRSDRFQLRVGKVGALGILARLPALFRGELEDERIFDYLCTAVSIECADPRPFQIGGDEVGRRERVVVRLSSVRAISRERRGDQPAVV